MPVKGYDVGGVRLPRPFHVQRLGHVGLSQRDLDGSAAFWCDKLGFRATDVLAPPGAPQPLGVFTNCGMEQVRWDRRSKPRALFTSPDSQPTLPEPAEYAEVLAAEARLGTIPAELRRALQDEWPDGLDPLSDTNTNLIRQGPMA